MNRTTKATPKKSAAAPKREPSREIKYQESPVERALKLSSDQALAIAIRDLINRDELN